MEKISWNKDWYCNKKGENAWKAVQIPHDAMREEERSPESSGGVNTGWIVAGDYTYRKEFFVPRSWEESCLLLEFEGVYHRARIYINNRKASEQHNGYLNFYVPLQGFLRYGEKNEIRVEVTNSDQPNSRWYTGTGIYRPVWLYQMPQEHIVLQSIRITTESIAPPQIRIQAETIGGGPVKAEILDGEHVIASVEAESGGRFEERLTLTGAECWNTENPRLYRCRLYYQEDMQEEMFGIRMLTLDEEKGFCLNGKRVILKGACVHHDNGILGACAYDFAERRKVELIRKNGYNAIRSAHNPCSKAMLRACDELGVLLVDEYADAWYIHKTKYDYASEVEKRYPADLKAIVDKDYNHPSVIMYSTGNEVSETAQKRGIELGGAMTEYLHGLDETRPVTCGINIFFNFLSSMGFGVYSDKKAEKEAEKQGKKKEVGSAFFNQLAGIMGAGFMKWGATLPPCDRKTREAYAGMDVAGYNYGIRRYEIDLKKYPKRWILGTETFCADAFRFYRYAEKNRRIVGDFVWSGMDYLGEVGIGAWEYPDYAPEFSHGTGWVAAGAGRIDLTGKATAEMAYTRVVFGTDAIGIGVIPVPYTGKKHSPSAWKMTNALESWSWNGCDGMPAEVEVYAKAAKVSLHVNGTCVGTKKVKVDCKTVFRTIYRNGELKAESYDEAGRKLAEKKLYTAGERTVLCLEPERKTITQEELCYVRLQLTDEKGTVKPLERSKISVAVENGELLGTGSACAYSTEKYPSCETDTYYGEALAIIRPFAQGILKISADSRFGKTETEIEVK